MIHFREIDKENINAILDLKVSDTQKQQVATNAVSIAQGSVHDQAWYRAIYNSDIPVGFVMLSIDSEKEEYWIWRFMVDSRYQGKGFGMKALELVIQHFRGIPGVSEIKLSYVPAEETSPAPFYGLAGFEDTGEMEEGEMIMRLKL